MRMDGRTDMTKLIFAFRSLTATSQDIAYYDYRSIMFLNPTKDIAVVMKRVCYKVGN